MPELTLPRFGRPPLSHLTPGDPRFGEIIANGPQFKIKDLRSRNAQQYGKGLLIGRWREIEKDHRKNDRVAREPPSTRCDTDRWKLLGSPWKLTRDIGTPDPFVGTPEPISAMLR